jgi:DsbC/DsbD-like thiol-disulfide interchange protein
MRRSGAVISLALAVGAGTSVLAQPRPYIGSGTAHAHASITTVSVAPHRAQLLVTLAVDPGWHVSWRNPGETGLPTRLTWSLPARVRVRDETWPVPVIAHTPVGATHTLEGDVPWLIDFDVDSATVADRLISLTLRYGICREVCIPERITVQGALPGRDARGTAIPTAVQARLARRGDAIPARRQSPTRVCLAQVPMARASGIPEIIADSGLALDAALALTAESHAGNHVFLMNIPATTVLPDGARVLLVHGNSGIAATLDFHRAAPGCAKKK